MLKRNFLYNLAYQTLAIALPLVTAPYLSRALGSSGLGTYSYTFSIAQYFVLFAMLGVNNYGSRSIAVARRDGQTLSCTFWGIWFLQALLTIGVLILYGIYSFCFSGSIPIAAVWIPYVVSAALDVNWFFFGLEKFKVTVTRNFVIKLITFVLTFIVVKGEFALGNYLVLMSCSQLISVMVLWPFVVKEVQFRVPSRQQVMNHVKPNLILFIPVIAISLYTVLDKVMLGQMAGMSETGIFENSLKVAQMPFSLIVALGTVMLPHASNLYSEGKMEQAIAYMGPSMWFALLLSSAFTFGLIAISPDFVPIFFGDGFAGCVTVMPVIVLEMPFMAWANVIRTQWLIPKGDDRAYVASVLAGAIVNIAVNILLIPRAGALGAAFGTLAAEVAVCIVQTKAAFGGGLPFLRWASDSVPGFIIGVLMLVLVRFSATVLPDDAFGLVAEILVGVISYSVMSVIWFLATRNIYLQRLLRSILSKGQAKQSSR